MGPTGNPPQRKATTMAETISIHRFTPNENGTYELDEVLASLSHLSNLSQGGMRYRRTCQGVAVDDLVYALDAPEWRQRVGHVVGIRSDYATKYGYYIVSCMMGGYVLATMNDDAALIMMNDLYIYTEIGRGPCASWLQELRDDYAHGTR